MIIGDSIPKEWLDECGLTRDSTIQELAENLLWGTYGPYACAPLRWTKLIDCATDHLINILRTQPHVQFLAFKLAIIKILNQRGLNQTAIYSMKREMGYEQLKLTM